MDTVLMNIRPSFLICRITWKNASMFIFLLVSTAQILMLFQIKVICCLPWLTEKGWTHDDQRANRLNLPKLKMLSWYKNRVFSQELHVFIISWKSTRLQNWIVFSIWLVRWSGTAQQNLISLFWSFFQTNCAEKHHIKNLFCVPNWNRRWYVDQKRFFELYKKSISSDWTEKIVSTCLINVINQERLFEDFSPSKPFCAFVTTKTLFQQQTYA